VIWLGSFLVQFQNILESSEKQQSSITATATATATAQHNTQLLFVLLSSSIQGGKGYG
jgi:hypothetical protein